MDGCGPRKQRRYGPVLSRRSLIAKVDNVLPKEAAEFKPLKMDVLNLF